MSKHDFKTVILPDQNTLMICSCGLTYHWRSSGYWRQVGFENERGTDIEPPVFCGSAEQEGEETSE